MTELLQGYQTSEPNEDVVLHEGALELRTGKECLRSQGAIRLRWLPRPAIRFDMPDVKDHKRATAFYEATDAKLWIDGAIKGAQVLVNHMSCGWPEKPVSLRGALNNSALEIGSGQNLSYVVLHLPNFLSFRTVRDRADQTLLTQDWDFRRIVLATDGVRITIEPVDNCGSLIKELRRIGGYAITHVGKMEAVDASALSVDMVKSTMHALHHFLSFVCGSVVQPILPVGFDAQGNVAWQEWASWRMDSWGSEYSPWCDAAHGECVSAAFPGFMARYRTPVWEKPLRDAIHWYVVSERRQGLYVEDAVVLTQAALEMLAWVVLVEDPATAHFAPDQFDRLNAAQKLRCLLNWAGIPRAIPSETQELGRIASPPIQKRKRKRKGKWRWSDGPEACTAIRNSIVHATQEKRSTMEEIPSMAPVEACILALWYLDLVLLRLFGYSGVYGNRLKRRRFVGDVEPVPWATEDAAPTE